MSLQEQEIIKQQQQIIDELHNRMTRYEFVEQNLRDTQNKLDAKIDMLDRIHQYTRQAFLQDEKGLMGVISEGVVDIFQLEIGAVFTVDYQQKALILQNACNLDVQLPPLPLPGTGMWSKNHAFSEQTVICENPAVEPLWKPLQLHSLIYVPLLDNDRNLQGVILGGLSKESYMFYTPSYEELKSPFIVFCQQMNGIMNNIEALEKAKAASHAKTRFLANLSHEIRTPMNAIGGMLQVAKRSQDTARITDCLAQIQTASEQLLEMLGDILDISKIEEDKLTLGYETIDIKTIVSELMDTFQPQAARRCQTLSETYHHTTAMTVRADKQRLTQVLSNLLSNAIKFTPESGRINLAIERLQRDRNKVLLRFSVTDNGIGIAKDLQQQIFIPFEQADGSSSRKYGGTGLGLAISQHIVGLMGGTIQVDSIQGEGATFHFSIWLDLVEEQIVEEHSIEIMEHTDYDFCGRKIMVVDDIEVNRMIIRTFLEDKNVSLIEAENGQEALDYFAQSAEGEITAILMDIQMPVMDGCTSARMIRELPRKDAQKVGIFAMTANVFQEDIQKVLDAGMDAHIGKPVDYDVVLGALYWAVAQR